MSAATAVAERLPDAVKGAESISDLCAALGCSRKTLTRAAGLAQVSLPDGRSARLKRRHADPAFNPLVRLTAAERADYDAYRGAGYRRAEALRAIGRADLAA